MPEMTCEERMLCALSREEPDRVPLYDLVDNKRILEHYAGCELTLENAPDVIPQALSKCLDHTRIWMPSAPGRRVDEHGLIYERRDWFNEWVVEKPFQDIPGLIQFVKADIEREDAWTPVDDQKWVDELLDWKRKFRGTTIPASMSAEALTDAAILIGFDQFIYLEQEEPDLVRRWVEAKHNRQMRNLENERIRRQVSPVGWDFADMAYNYRLIFSPAYLRSHGVFRRIAEACDSMHNQGLKVIFHSDGLISQVVPDLIAAGVDALAPIDTVAGMHLEQLKKDFGDKVAFVGGIDLGLLSAGSVEDVRKAVLYALKVAGQGGGLVVGSSSEELYDKLPFENVLAMFETVHECGRYPIGKFFPKGFSQ